MFCVFVILGFWKKESRASRTKSHPAEELWGQSIGQESAVEERPCQRKRGQRGQDMYFVSKKGETIVNE